MKADKNKQMLLTEADLDEAIIGQSPTIDDLINDL